MEFVLCRCVDDDKLHCAVRQSAKLRTRVKCADSGVHRAMPMPKHERQHFVLGVKHDTVSCVGYIGEYRSQICEKEMELRQRVSSGCGSTASRTGD